MPVIDRKTRLKARRILRRQRRQVENVTSQADADIDNFVLKRFGRLIAVRRFVALWAVLVLLLGFGAFWQVRGLDRFYLENAPVSGGVYREGIIGTFTNANPLFATSSVDVSVSKLIFSGLFKLSPNGELENDLANELKVDAQGKVYTVTLRQDVIWHDGEPFDADDVVFTYKTIQNVDARSPLQANWKGVKVTKTDAFTVKFELPSALSSFSSALTNGIVPQHILQDVDSNDLRSSNFNTTEPIGTGPFTLRTLEVVGTDLGTRQERIALNKYEKHHGVVAGLDSVIIRSYRTEESMVKDFDEQIIQSMVGLSSVTERQLNQSDVTLVTAPLTSSVMVFLNNSNGILSSKKVRQALVHATNVDEIRKGLGFNVVPSDSPLLRSQFAYDPEQVQLSYNVAAAQKILEEEGWVLNDKGVRVKEGKELSFRLVSQSLSEYAAIAQKIQGQWAKIGVKVEALLQPEEDIQSGAISRHDYDILLYGISIGYDPDVFAYWHSSQADPNAQTRLNLSEYKNEIADEALEAGRTRVDEDLRKLKYKPFLESWRDDAPAIALYQPRFLMVVRGTFEGFVGGQMGSATDRYWSISEWKVRNDQVVK